MVIVFFIIEFDLLVFKLVVSSPSMSCCGSCIFTPVVESSTECVFLCFSSCFLVFLVMFLQLLSVGLEYTYAMHLCAGSCIAHVECGTSHVECGTGHVECGTSHVECGTGHVECGTSHVDCGTGHVESGTSHVE